MVDLLWTLLVLNGPWLVVLRLMLSWLLSGDLLGVHVGAGYLVGLFVTVRFILGFVS